MKCNYIICGELFFDDCPTAAYPTVKLMFPTALQQSGYFLVVDDHEAIIEGTVPALKKQYPGVGILTAQDRHTAQHLMEEFSPVLIVIDLSLPEALSAAPILKSVFSGLRL